MKSKIYPISFSPVCMSRMWGGGNLLQVSNLNTEILKRDANFLDKGISEIGEIWLFTDREDAQSVVTNGCYKGLTLNQLWRQHAVEVFGQKTNSADIQPKDNLKEESNSFPLLIKLINANDDLSLQVHPNESDCKKIPNSQPKTELWYIVNCHENAEIIAGFKPQVAEQLSANNSIEATSLADILVPKNSFQDGVKLEVKDYLNVYTSGVGQSYYIPAGTVHAIGKGNLVFEIQQNSDTTYRVSDWGRLDKDGNPRQLHVKEALQCINPKLQPVIAEGALDDNIIYLTEANNNYFTLRKVNLKPSQQLIVYTKNGYEMVTILQGKVKVNLNETNDIFMQNTEANNCAKKTNLKVVSLENKSQQYQEVEGTLGWDFEGLGCSFILPNTASLRVSPNSNHQDNTDKAGFVITNTGLAIVQLLVYHHN